MFLYGVTLISATFELTVQYRMWMYFFSDISLTLHNLKNDKAGRKALPYRTQTC